MNEAGRPEALSKPKSINSELRTRTATLMLACAAALPVMLWGCKQQPVAKAPFAPSPAVDPAAVEQPRPEPTAEEEPDPRANERTRCAPVGEFSVDRFAAAVRPLATATNGGRHASIEALRTFGQVLPELSPANLRASTEIRWIAELLDYAPGASTSHTTLVKQGLEHGFSAFTSRAAKTHDEVRYRIGVQRLRAAIDEIDVEETLSRERARVARAFRAAVNVTAIARGAPLPFHDAQLDAR